MVVRWLTAEVSTADNILFNDRHHFNSSSTVRVDENTEVVESDIIGEMLKKLLFLRNHEGLSCYSNRSELSDLNSTIVLGSMLGWW